MRKFIAVSTLFAAVSVAGISFASDTDYFKVGMNIDLSMPSGAAIGLDARLPHVPWFKLGLSATATLAPGIRGNVLIDPINFPIAPVANIDIGHQFGFTVPTVNNSPTVNFDYIDLQGGLGIGSRDGFRLLLMVGMTHMDVAINNFQGVVSSNAVGQNLTVADPSVTGWVPSAKLGCYWLF
jgi:hypothetical protein